MTKKQFIFIGSNGKMQNVKYLTIDQCKHGYLYLIRARNFKYGVFNSERNGFIGIREKFGKIFLFEEYHWDNGPPFGTVKPLQELFRIPNNLVIDEYLQFSDPEKNQKAISNKDLFDYLNNCLQFMH